MSLILSGTDGLSDIDGTAATPAIRGTDANTGIFFPAADTIAFSEGGVEAMRIDSSGNVGIGTASPVAKLDITSGTARMYFSNQSATAFFTAVNTANSAYALMAINGSELILKTGDAERVRIDSSGNVGIGTSSPAARLSVDSSSTGLMAVLNSTAANGGYIVGRSSGTSVWDIGTSLQTLTVGTSTDMGINVRSGFLALGTANTERMRIDSSGNVGIGTSSPSEKFCVTTSANASTAFFLNNNGTATNQYGIVVKLNGDPNNVNHMLQCLGGANLRAEIRSNGGIANYTANNSPLSDRRLKKDITPAGSYLEKICAIPVVNYFFKDQTDDLVNLGVIAQDVLAVAPELCNKEGWGTKDEDGSNYLGIWETDIQYALMKCIQEMKTIIDQQAERIAALEDK